MVRYCSVGMPTINKIPGSWKEWAKMYPRLKAINQLEFRNTFHRRCVLTGRPRALIPKYRISRIKFHQFASQGRLPGVQKSSW